MSAYQHLGTELCVSGSYFKTRRFSLVVHSSSNRKDIYARFTSPVPEQRSYIGSYNMFSNSIPHHYHSLSLRIRLLPSAYSLYVTTSMWGRKAEFRTVPICSSHPILLNKRKVPMHLSEAGCKIQWHQTERMYGIYSYYKCCKWHPRACDRRYACHLNSFTHGTSTRSAEPFFQRSTGNFSSQCPLTAWTLKPNLRSTNRICVAHIKQYISTGNWRETSI